MTARRMQRAAVSCRPKLIQSGLQSRVAGAVACVAFLLVPSLMHAASEPGLLLLGDGIEPTMRDIYGAAWFLLVPVFLALWLLGAEVVVRILAVFSTRDKAVLSGAAGAGMAIGASYNPSGRERERGDAASAAFLGLLVFGIFMLAMWLFSKRFVTYPLAVFLFMASYAGASDRVSEEMAAEEARNNPDLILPIELVTLATSPALIGASETPSLRVALRVHNHSVHDLTQVVALCTFFLRNGNVAHSDELIFPADYRIPSGFGGRLEARSPAPRQFDSADYANRVSCDLRSGYLRSIGSASVNGGDSLTVLAINENNQTIKVRNESGRGISSFSIQCLGTAVSGYGSTARVLGENHAGWIRYGSLRREFRREGEPMVRPNTDEIIEYSNRSEKYLGDSAHDLKPTRNGVRCDVTRIVF